MATIVYFGNIQYCDNSQKWQDVTLTLFSDASLTLLYLQTNKTEKHDTPISAVAAATSKFTGCFVVSPSGEDANYDCGIIFFAPDKSERKKWIRTFNETRLKANYAIKHPHPLKIIKYSSIDEIMCILCSRQSTYIRYRCEQCNYEICERCGAHLAKLPRLPSTDSQSHPQDLEAKEQVEDYQDTAADKNSENYENDGECDLGDEAPRRPRSFPIPPGMTYDDMVDYDQGDIEELHIKRK